MKKKRDRLPLEKRYPPSEPCGCEICRGYCRRPGWWTAQEAKRAIAAGYGGRMMLEMAPDMTFGVLSPAFMGCEADFARQEYAALGCGFLEDGLCGLHGTGFQPLECRFCHHDRTGQGPECYAALERDWNSPAGHALVALWADSVGLWERYGPLGARQ